VKWTPKAVQEFKIYYICKILNNRRDEMSKSTEKYSQEFKERAVLLLLEKGKKASQLSLELGVPSSYLSHWKRDYLKKQHRINGSSPQTLEDAGKRIKELENELLVAKEERDILKKAVSFFAKA
jgi:transposase